MREDMTKFLRQTFQIYKHKMLHDFIMLTLGGEIARRGFTFRPYYIFKEGLFDAQIQDYEIGIPDYQINFLTHEDMTILDQMDGRNLSALSLQDRLSKGHKCLGLRIDGNITAFTWCQFDLFNFPAQKGFPLRENEAYLYDMYVFKASRGLNLASLLRNRCYKELALMGRTTLYSISDVLNKPSIRFKKKLDAKIVGFGLYIRIDKNRIGKNRWDVKLMIPGA